MSVDGMDVEQVRSLGQQFSQQAQQIRDLANQLTTNLGNVAWTGADRNQFVQDWQSNQASQLNTVAEAVEQAGKTLTANAQEQERISTPGSSGGGGALV